MLSSRLARVKKATSRALVWEVHRSGLSQGLQLPVVVQALHVPGEPGLLGFEVVPCGLQLRIEPGFSFLDPQVGARNPALSAGLGVL